MLKGKTAIITGASRGIGWETVRLFAENGAKVWACTHTFSEEFEKKLNEVSKKTVSEIHPVYFDVTDDAAAKAAIRKIGKESGTIDILVNNAGVSIERLFSMTSLEFIREMMDVNYLAQIHLAQLVSRYMMKQKAGSIVNVASVSGMDSEEGGLAYGSSKAAVIFSSCTMAMELGVYGIRVNSVSQGFIATDMWEKRQDAVRERILRETPLGRQGKPREVAEAILFLACDKSSYITGQNLVVDGGRKKGR